MSDTLISVVMSVYNGQKYLAEAIESILNQTFADFEFIIIDDGSTDKSLEIIQSFSQKDNRIRIIQNEKNIGLTASLNKGISQASGEYVARMDADDISMPERLAKQVEILESDPSTVLVSCLVEISIHNGNSLVEVLNTEKQLIKWELLFHNYLGGHGQVMFRRIVGNQIIQYDETYSQTQDYELWTRLAEKHSFFILPDVYYRFRLHGENISILKNDIQDVLKRKASKIAIESLLNKQISNYTFENIQSFWSGHKIETLEGLLLCQISINKMYQFFISDRLAHDKQYKENKKMIADEIAMKYLRLARKYFHKKIEIIFLCVLVTFFFYWKLKSI